MVSKWWHCSVLYRILIHVHVRFLPNCAHHAAKYAPALKMLTKNIIYLSHIVCRLVIVSHCEYWEYLSLQSKEKRKIDQLWHYLTFFFPLTAYWNESHAMEDWEENLRSSFYLADSYLQAILVLCGYTVNVRS